MSFALKLHIYKFNLTNYTVSDNRPWRSIKIIFFSRQQQRRKKYPTKISQTQSQSWNKFSSQTEW